MCSIISINKNNKIINLYDPTLLPGGESDCNELLPWLPLVPPSASPFDQGPPPPETNEKLQKGLEPGPGSTAAYTGWIVQQILKTHKLHRLQSEHSFCPHGTCQGDNTFPGSELAFPTCQISIRIGEHSSCPPLCPLPFDLLCPSLLRS